MNRETLKQKFSQTVGVTKAEEILQDAESMVGIESESSYSDHTVRDLCEHIEIEYDGYISEVAHGVRVQTEAKQRFDTLLENVSSPVVIVRFEQNEIRIRAVNDAFTDAFSYSSEEVIGKSLDALIAPEGKTIEHDIWFQQGTEKEREVIRTTATGERRTFLRRTAVANRPDGSVEGYGIYTDITERKERERVLEAQRDNLNILSQVVRHDIRNNLQIIDSYAHILNSHVDTEGKEYLERIFEAADEAVGITKTAREVTEMTLNTELDLFPTEVADVIETTVGEVRSGYDHASVAIDGSIPPVEVLADEMLDSVFRNLLKNAIIHNDSKIPEVIVSGTAVENSIRIKIADNGPGIPDEQKEQIFDEGKKGLDSEGTGLGLYLVQTLVDRYNGNVWVENRKSDQRTESQRQDNQPNSSTDSDSTTSEPVGSVFIVTLPSIADE